MKSLLASITTLVVLFIFVSGVDSAPVTCSPKQDPILVNTTVVLQEFIVDFEVEIQSDKPSNTLFEQDGFNVTLRGTGDCRTFGVDFNLGHGGWISNERWFPDNDTNIGRFLGLDIPADGYCEITFSETIGHFSMRLAAQQGVDVGMFVLDEADEELNCNIFPWVTGQNSNAYSIRGFSASQRNIKKILFKDSYFVADLLFISRCPAGYRFEEPECILVDPCAVLPAPCGSNSNCTQFDSTAVCNCLEHYEGNAITGCTPVSCASELCNENSTCADVVSEPFVTCTCNSGFVGDGFGPTGCTAVPGSAPTLRIPSSAPKTATPITNTPVSSPRARTSSATILINGILSASAFVIFLTLVK